MISKFRITGVDRTIAAGRKTKTNDGRNIEKTIWSCLGVIYRKSQVYVPRDTGDLAASGERVMDGKGLAAKGLVHYGGPLAPHAFVVHEVPMKHAPPTRSHYLSAAVNDTRGTCVSILRRQMKVTK